MAQMRKFTYRKVIVLLLSLPLFLSYTMFPASASNVSSQQAALSVSTSVWGSQVAALGGIGTTSPYVITWTGNTNKQNVLISLFNVGSINLSTGRISFSSIKANGDSTTPPNLVFDLCSGTWDPVTFSCSGAITTFGSSSGGQLTIPQMIAVGARLDVRVVNNHNMSGNYLTTINALATRSDIRIGLRINS